MNDDLNASLHRAVDSALDQAMTADQMHRAVAERIRAKRRRRPALIIGGSDARPSRASWPSESRPNA